MKSPAAFLSIASLTVACAFLTGCESSRPPPPDDRAIAAAKTVGLRGEGIFFDGKLRAEATVSRGRPVPFKGDEGRGDGQRGGGRHGGRRPPGGAMGGGGDFGGRGGETDDGSPTLHMRASSLPPVTLRLKLTNLSTEPLDVQVRDLKSDLGDFAVRPERLLLAPAQAAEVDPMVSQLGVLSDQLPVTVGLRLGGRKETHDLLLTPVSHANDEPK